MTTGYLMHCGGCGAEIPVSRTEYDNPALHIIPCTDCADGGVDLDHARRHA